MKKILEIIKTIFIFIIILFVIFFSIVNSDIVKINFDFFPFNFVIEIRIFLLIIFCFCFGFICGIATTSYSLMLKYFENFKNKRRAEKLEEKVKTINNEIGSNSEKK